jgi:zinc/manganese transport system substrate-binding protein
MASEMRWLALLLAVVLLRGGEPVPVVATVPEIGALVRSIGGDDVQLTVLARPEEDPHRVEARPSFVVALSRAELLVATGAELEMGWLPTLVTQSRNRTIRSDGAGYVEAAALVRAPIGVPQGPIDRSAGHVHAQGNPHVLLDPAVGLALAEEVAARLGRLRPEAAGRCGERLQDFRRRLGAALAGEGLAARLDIGKLIQLDDKGRLHPFLAEQGLSAELGGWWGLLRPYAGVVVAADHDLYPYLARRFALRIGHLLEPKPGVPPSTRYLAGLAERMRADGVQAILASPYFDRKLTDLAAGSLQVPIAELAHQAGARPGTEDYLAWIDANVRAIATALAR